MVSMANPDGMDDLDLMPLITRRNLLLSRKFSSSSPAPSGSEAVSRVSPGAPQKWPGLPRGVKFYPSDEELLWHLLAKVGKGEAKPHPFISEFIISINDDGFGYSHPYKIPGIKQDGSPSYYFHRTFKTYDTKCQKRRKEHFDDFGVVRWHKIGKTKPVYMDGIHKGSKQVMTLYMSMAGGEKPEKTNWMMHQYHIGTREEKEGEFVVSKFFYQLKSRQDDKHARDLSLDAADAAGKEGESVAAPKTIRLESYEESLHPSLKFMEASSQATCHGIHAEEITCYSGLWKHDGNANLPAEKSKQEETQRHCLLDSRQHGDDIFEHSEVLGRQSCSGAEIKTSRNYKADNGCLGDNNMKKEVLPYGTDTLKGDNNLVDTQSSNINCKMVSEGEASCDLLDTQACVSSLELISSPETKHHISGQRVVGFSTCELLEHSCLPHHPSGVKVGCSDGRQTNPCNEGADNISRADRRVSMPSTETECEGRDHFSLLERCRSLLTSIDQVLDCPDGLESSQNCRQYALEPGSSSLSYAKDSETIPKIEKDGSPMSQMKTHCGRNFSVPQEVLSKISVNEVSSINQCTTVKVKEELHPCDGQFLLEECYIATAEHDATNSVASTLLESSKSMSEGSLCTVSQFSPCQLNQGRVDAVCYQASAEVNLPVVGKEHGHVSSKSQPHSSTFLIQLKTEPSDEELVKNKSEAHVSTKYNSDILFSTDKATPVCSTVFPCFPEAKSHSDYPYTRSSESQQNKELEHRCSDDPCISEARLPCSLQSLVHQNDNNHQSVLSVFTLEAKDKPSESGTKCMPKESSEKLWSPSLSTERSCSISQCLSEASPQDSHLLEGEGRGLEENISTRFCSNQTSIPNGVHYSSSVAKLVGKAGSDSCDSILSKNFCIIDRGLEKDSNFEDNVLLNGSSLRKETDSTCSDQASVPELKFESNHQVDVSVLSGFLVKPKLECVESGSLDHGLLSGLSELDLLRSEVKREYFDGPTTDMIDMIDHISLKERMGMLVSGIVTNLSCDNNMESSQQAAPLSLEGGSCDSANAKASCFSLRKRKRKRTATDSVETALEEDAPGLLQVLLNKGITVEEIKLYGDMEDDDLLPISSTEECFEELEAVITKLFSEGPSIFKFPAVRQTKGSKDNYCLACLISLIEQARYLRFRQSPVEWGWCRDLQSFIFVFETHNRIVLERPEYGYATYFFELVESLPIGWQIRRLVTAMKLPCCSRTILLENKPLLVGEDLSEGEARVLEEYGWTRNSGVGTMLNYCDRVVHNNKNERYDSEWRAKIGKLLMRGHDLGRTVLSDLPKKVVQYIGYQNPEIKLEL